MALQHVQSEIRPSAFRTMQEDFGALIDRVRRRSRVEIQELAALFPEYLPRWDRFTYTHTVGERKRVPGLGELFPLYQALVIAGVHFLPEERNLFVALARAAIESKRGTHPAQREWDALLEQMVEFDQLPAVPTEPVPLQAELRHLVGRDAWVREMQAHLTAQLPAKLVIIQAALGAGKSSAMHLLRRSLEEEGSHQICTYTCSSAVDMTAEEHLARFLAEASELLGITARRGEGAPPALDEQASWLMAHLARLVGRVVFFIDNGENLMGPDGQLAGCWQAFFTAFAHLAHTCTIFFATRAWPGWAGRDRSYVVQHKMPPLVPQEGATILRRMGLFDVEETLLEHMSARCGGNPWLLELRASTLQDLPFVDGEDADPPVEGENAHTRLVKRLLRRPHLFEGESDHEALSMLDEVLGTHLGPGALWLLDLLACSPLALPFSILREQAAYEERAFAELLHSSLIDLDSKIYAQRAQLLPIVAEAAAQRAAVQGRSDAAEQEVIVVYKQWLVRGSANDQEKSAVVAELCVLFLKRLRLLEAAEYVLRYNWLLARFGHVTRIARMSHALLESEPWRANAQRECGGLLLRYFLAPQLGKKIGGQERGRTFQMIYRALLEGHVALQVPTQLYVVDQLMSWHRDALRFDEAEALLNQTFERLPGLEETHPNRFASLLGKKAVLLGYWSDYAEEQGQAAQAGELREQVIALYERCVSLWLRCEERAPGGKRSTYKYRRARHLNDLGYYLRRQGRYDDALEAIRQSLQLKGEGYVEPGSLATGYSERAQCLLALGRFQEALDYDRLAVEDIRQAAASGNSALREEEAVYLIERAQLYLRLGRLEEAESLIEESKGRLQDDRRSHRDLAGRALEEIREWRKASPQGQLDWRWLARYREIVWYDPFQWLAQAAFTEEERREWMKLQEGGGDLPALERQMRMDALVAQSRDRETIQALAEGREPRLYYPYIPEAEIEHKRRALDSLAGDIAGGEPNAIVAKLYLDVIDEHQSYLQMILATHRGQAEAFARHNEAIHGRPEAGELERALVYVGHLIALGRQRADTLEVSERVHALLRSAGVPVSVPASVKLDQIVVRARGATPPPARRFSPQTLKRFLDETMAAYGFDGWETIIDATASVERIEQLTQRLILPDKPMTLQGVRQLLKEEVEDHLFRASAGGKSRLDLLATGTRGFMATEEGLAQFKDREFAQQQGNAVEEFSAAGLFGLLSTGLAAGVLSRPLTFSRLYAFLAEFLVLYRIAHGLDKEDVARARTKAVDIARQRCLRTYRGVPDLTVAGCYLKDWLYHHGLLEIQGAVRRDRSVLQRLMVGVIGLEQLPDMEELGITDPPQPPRWLAYDPDLERALEAYEYA